MAGSYDHLLTEEQTYRGPDLLENMGDMAEAVEEMFFIIKSLANNNERAIMAASNAYYRCYRGEQPWPEWMKPGVADSRSRATR